MLDQAKETVFYRIDASSPLAAIISISPGQHPFIVILLQGFECSVLEKEMATHSGILAWEIPWTEGPGGLWSMGF